MGKCRRRRKNYYISFILLVTSKDVGFGLFYTLLEPTQMEGYMALYELAFTVENGSVLYSYPGGCSTDTLLAGAVLMFHHGDKSIKIHFPLADLEVLSADRSSNR